MKLSKVFLWRAATSLLLASGVANTVHANPASHDLGQAFPHAINQSLSPLWRVYVFEREGVRYFQINGAFGRVHAVFATARGNFLVLPEGDDADRVVVPKASANQEAMCQGDNCSNGIHISDGVATAQLGKLIYQDTTLQIRQTENAQHQPVWWVTPLQPTLTQP